MTWDRIADLTGVRNDWTADEDAVIKTMWGKYRCDEIAALLGRTLDAAAGRAYRLGLCKHRTKRVKFIPLAKKPSRASSMTDDEKVAAENAEVDAEKPAGYRLADLKSRQCRWPVHSIDDVHFFCGAPKVDGAPYCSEHCALAYNGFGSFREQWPAWR
jgi:GcrA cell cycle regulator